ncbi:MAG: metallophosphoesterase [Planctomycetota bacterium]
MTGPSIVDQPVPPSTALPAASPPLRLPRSVPAVPDLLPADRRRAPIPVGPLTGRRTWWRRWASIAAAGLNRAVDRLPPGRWLHARAQRQLEVHFFDVALRRGGRGLDGMKLAFLSDLHAGSCMDERDLCRIFARVMETAPDAVCLGGDLINTREREILLYREPLKLLRAPLGVFAVPGNHDHFFGRDIGLWQAFLQDQGVQVLCNRGMRLEREGAGVWLCGVDDLTEATPDLAAALQGWNGQEPVVLLSHHPDFFFEAAAVGVDVTLSGHTHGGQIRVFGKVLCQHSRFGWLQGRVINNGHQLYVSRGVGVTVLPVRYGAPPEIPVLRLSAAER